MDNATATLDEQAKEPKTNKRNNTKEIITKEQAKAELVKAEEELATATEKVKELKATLKYIQGNRREPVKKYHYDIDEDKINELHENKTVIYGMNDLFRHALTIKEITEDGKEIKIDLNSIQISERIRKQGMKRIQEYCTIDKESPRIFYIKSIKNVNDMRTLNREAKIAGLHEQIAKSKKEAERLKNL